MEKIFTLTAKGNVLVTNTQKERQLRMDRCVAAVKKKNVGFITIQQRVNGLETKRERNFKS